MRALEYLNRVKHCLLGNASNVEGHHG